MRTGGQPVKRVRGVAGVAVVALVSASCGGSSDGRPAEDRSIDDEQATATEGASDSGPAPSIDDPNDERDDVLAELGAPDAFVIQVGDIDGEASRYESWTYFDASTQLDFLDGQVLWDIEIDAVEDGALLPLLYSPAEFELLASKADTTAILEGIELVEVDASELEIEGAEVLAGEQLLLAFVDDRLVYVETYVLAPGEQEVE